MRSYLANHNLIAVSASLKETAINTEQAMNMSIAASLDDVFGLEYRRENNSNEATGMEEPDYIYDNGATSTGSLNFPKAQPQHFAFLLSYALGVSTPTAAGIGKLHTITPIIADVDANRSLPSFTAMQRYGKMIFKRRFMSMFVDGITASFKKDDFVGISGDIKGTGKFVDNVIEETISALGTAVSLNLAVNGVQGATAEERLDNVQRVRVQDATGAWIEVAYSAVSSATPAAITITSPGLAATNFSYKVLYVPVEAAQFTFPAKIQETPLRVAELTVNMGGKWNGTAFVGGRTLSSEINSIEWKLANNLDISFVPGAGGSYAASAFREGRAQSISLDRKMKEMILQRHLIDNTQFGVRILAEGALYDGANKYQVEMIFPLCAVLKDTLKVDGKVMAESGDLQVLQDATYGSVIVKVKNLQSGYAQ
jgi:hypothetical protein